MAVRIGIPASRPLQWTVNDHPVPGGVSSRSLDNVYPAPTATVDWALSGDALTVTNRPSDGNYRIWIDCFPADPSDRAKGGSPLIFDFAPGVRIWEQDYYNNMEACSEAERAMLSLIFSRLHTISQAVPRGGDPASQILEAIDRRTRSIPGMSHAARDTVRQVAEFNEGQKE